MADNNDALYAYAMGADNNRNCNNGWGGDGGWLWILVIFALLGFGGNGMWGNGGFGGGAGLQGALTRGDLCSEFNFNGLESAVRATQRGISDSTYALNNTIVNGFANNARDLCTGLNAVTAGIAENRFANQQCCCDIQGAITNAQFANQTGLNALSTQLAQCCCDNRSGQKDIQNTIQSGFCQTNYNDQVNTTSIIQNAHNDTDRILARLDAMEMNRKDETIAMLREKLSQADLAASQAAQNNYLVNQLRPCPQPAYLTCNPFTGQTYSYGSYNNGCGCNNNVGCGCC